MTTALPCIEVRQLRKWYPVRQGLAGALLGRAPRQLKAVDGVSFAVEEGRVLGLAGESGCGKSTTGMTVLKLHQPTGGEIRFYGKDLAATRRRPRHLNTGKDPLRLLVAFSLSGSEDELRQLPDFKLIPPGR